MDADEASGSSAPDAKRQKRDDQSDPSVIVPIDAPNPAEAAKIEQTADIFKLDIDCFEVAFDYLPIEDLVNVGKTCKRLQQVAGYCFQQNYSSLAEISSEEIHIRYELDVKHFAPFIKKIRIYRDNFKCFIASQSKYLRLKKIEFGELKTADMNRLKEISMSKLEVLRMFCCDMDNNFHEILDQCVKLRRLEIDLGSGEYDWFARKYPTLEYFRFDSFSSIAEGIPMFMELNPNIRKFATTAELLWKHRDEMMKSIVKLDYLAIQMWNWKREQLQPMCDLLNKLHKRDFYGKLQLYFIYEVHQEDIDKFATLNGLVKLNIDRCQEMLNLGALKDLEELFVDFIGCVDDLEILPENLINLKRIHFCFASIEDVLPFIRRSPEMQRIHINILQAGSHFNPVTYVIDLLALNREREQLALNRRREHLTEVDKITIYVNEEFYLATKWGLCETDFNLIRLQREESLESHNDF